MEWKILRQSKIECLGLDVDHIAVRLLHLVAQSGQVSIQSAIQSLINPDLKEEQTNATIHSIRQLVNQLGTNYRRVVTALSDSDVFSQLLSIDTTEPDWKKTALLTAAPSIPIPLDSLYFDFQIIKNDENKESVMGVFCRQDTAIDKQNLLKASGLRLITLEVESHALERSYRYLYDLAKYPDCWACIAINNHTLTLLLWHRQFVLGSLSDTLVSPHSLPAITTQLYQALMLLLGRHTTKTLKALWIVGDHPLCEAIQAESRIACELSKHPPNFYQPPNGIQLSEQDWMPFHIALGLALRGLT